MKTPLSHSNHYLRDPKQRAEMIHGHVVSSSAIEGVHLKKIDKAISKPKTVLKSTARNEFML